jgi:hypothetical protein
MSHTPYYYAPGGKYVLFLDLLGFTAFVRSSFQKKAEETDDREKEFELAQTQFKSARPKLNASTDGFMSISRSCCADHSPAASPPGHVARVLRLRVRDIRSSQRRGAIRGARHAVVHPERHACTHETLVRFVRIAAANAWLMRLVKNRILCAWEQVTLTFTSWNRICEWLREVSGLRGAA